MAKKQSKGGDSEDGSRNDPWYEREKQRYDNPIPSREALLEFLTEQKRPQTRAEIGRALGLEDPDQAEALRRRLRAMERDGQLVQNRRRGYVIVDNRDLVRGRIMGRADGTGFLMPDGGGGRVFLPPRQMRSLLNGDRAVVRVVGLDEHGQPEGELVEVLARGNRHIAGRYHEEHGVGFVVPENKRIHQDVIVPAEDRGGAEEEDLVVAELTAQPTERRQPIGRITEVLGDHIRAGMEVEVAARVHGIPTEWPDGVVQAAEQFGDAVAEADKGGERVDLREVPLVTIDGADARDFDDALYAEPTDQGWRLLVAIADVSHYVAEGGALDQEARERGNSVYFPRAVVPMLPEALSNGLCSLNPHVDRLCMVCEMEVDARGRLTDSRFYRAVMRSHARLTYDRVAQAVLQEDYEAQQEIGETVMERLYTLHGLYGALRMAREKRGAIDFESTETRMVFDDAGRITEIVPEDRHDIHKVVEECMIAANVATADFLLRNEIPALYRVHESPPVAKLEALRSFLSQCGLSLPGGDEPTGQDYREVMRQAQARPDTHLIQTVMLRSMQAAEYRPDNLGHFGLALDAYTHFTSPIRRYPDLVIHRAIGHLVDRKPVGSFSYSRNDLVTLGEHCSNTERRADEATRDAEMTLKCEYLSSRLGETFDGIVAAVTSFGLFVQLHGVHVDGLVHITNLENDFFHFDPVAHKLQGERTGKVYQLGDRVRVTVARVEKDDRKIDLEIEGGDASRTASKRRRRGGGR